MYEPNVHAVLRQLNPDDLVLDVGGWACPFNRADWVLDSEPFATRGFYRTFGGPASQGGSEERFTEATWVQRDICDREPWPFADRQFDFAICSHVLEDIRDPLWVCSELIRVAKRGYVEVPSTAFELSRGAERPGVVGLSHHRWFVEIDAEERSITFLMKFHFVHARRSFSIPRRLHRRMSERDAVQWLWWEGSFGFAERILHGIEAQQAAIEAMVARETAALRGR